MYSTHEFLPADAILSINLQFLAVAVVYNLMTYQSSGNPVSFYKTYPEFFFLLYTWQTVIGNLSP